MIQLQNKTNRKDANHNQDTTKHRAPNQVLCVSQGQPGSRKTSSRNRSPDRSPQERATRLLELPLQRHHLQNSLNDLVSSM